MSNSPMHITWDPAAVFCSHVSSARPVRQAAAPYMAVTSCPEELPALVSWLSINLPTFIFPNKDSQRKVMHLLQPVLL